MKEILTNAAKTSAKLITKVKAKSPELLVGAGVAGVIIGTFLACSGTVKAQDVLDEFELTKQDIEEAKSLKDDPEIETSSSYTEEDAKHDTVIAYANLAKGMVRCYGPAVAVTASSIACILWGFGILKGRHAALIAAYNTLDQGFSKYRERVKEALGDEKDKEFRYGIKEFVETEEVEGESGKKKKVKSKAEEITNELKDISPYARFFDETSLEWDSNPEYNLNFLRAKQSQMNDKFNADGYLFLNDVYNELGLKPSFPMGQMVGWLKGMGDDFVDFGLYNGKRSKVRDFVNGLEPAILLDFNVDGVIYDKI